MQPRSAERQRALSWEPGPHAPRRSMNLNEVPSSCLSKMPAVIRKRTLAELYDMVVVPP
jgi:hypothetical protein